MIHGTLLLDKPANISSNRVLSIIKKKLSIKKAGIVGILDPLATGMLPIVLNEATKLSKYIESYEKEYNVIAHLGYTSSTGDHEGVLTPSNKSISTISKDMILDIVKSFHGEQMQVPPMHSALKVNGTKLYKLARQGITIDRKPRKINISRIAFNSLINNFLSLTITCSKGTYIRTLIESIGEQIGIGAFTHSLRRTRIGNLLQENMLNLDDLPDLIPEKLVTLKNMIDNIDFVSINNDDVVKIRKGQLIYTNEYENHNDIAIFNISHNLIGLGKIIDSYIHPKRLINFD